MFMGLCVFRYEDHISNQRDATFYAINKEHKKLHLVCYLCDLHILHMFRINNCSSSGGYFCTRSM